MMAITKWHEKISVIPHWHGPIYRTLYIRCPEKKYEKILSKVLSEMEDHGISFDRDVSVGGSGGDYVTEDEITFFRPSWPEADILWKLLKKRYRWYRTTKFSYGLFEAVRLASNRYWDRRMKRRYRSWS